MSTTENTIIVAARSAIRDYKNYNCYICQENRNFRNNSNYMAFYYNNKISTTIPKILGYIDSINLKNPNLDDINIINVSSDINELKERLKLFLHALNDNNPWIIGNNKIIFLTSPTDIRTVNLSHEIINNKTDKSGKKRVPYTQSNRYSTISKLQYSYFTTELESN